MSNIWWKGATIYQVYPRSFYDGNQDGIGDLIGLYHQLDYIAALHVDAIWISPFFTSPMKDFGYDISDYCAVDPLFGTLDDFDRVLHKAHTLGLKVMIDQVLAHCSDQHAWFIESRANRDNPKADWFIWADPKPDGTPPNNWLSVFGGSAWQWDTHRRQYYLHHFLSSQPALNFFQPQVQQAALDNIRFWLERGVDGMRFDACNYHFCDPKLRNNPPAIKHDVSTVAETNPYGYQQHKYDKSRPENLAFLKKIRLLLNQYNAASVGEVGDDHSIQRMAQYTSNGDKLHMTYSFNFLTEQCSPSFLQHDAHSLNQALDKKAWVCWSIGNHDAVRVATRWGKRWPQAWHNQQPPQHFPRLALAFLLSLRGSACLYQGDELGLDEADITYEALQDPYGIAMWPEFKGRDGCRTPLPWQSQSAYAGFSSVKPWLPIGQHHASMAVDLQLQDPQSCLHFYRRALAFYKDNTLLREGDIHFVSASDALLVFERHHQDQQLTVVLNFSDTPQTWTTSKEQRLIDCPLTDGAQLMKQQLKLTAFGFALLH